MKRRFFPILLFACLGSFGQVADSAVRLVRLAGACNFRDLGGYPAAQGRHLVWGRIYRSAEIGKLTSVDQQELRRRKISVVVDFRGREEARSSPDKIDSSVRYIQCPAGSDGDRGRWMKALATLQSGGDSLMEDYYAQTEFLKDRYQPFFQELLQLPNDQALLFHCTAGKDRTGIGAALLLYALGVPESVIFEDYTASNYYRKAENERMVQMMVSGLHANEQVARDIAGVKDPYLRTTFEAIRKQYGSLDAFLSSQLGVGADQRALLLNKFSQ